MDAEERNETVRALGLENLPLTGGCGPEGSVIRNGEAVRTLGELTARDAEVEARGYHRVPHGAEADAILASGRADKVGVEIALDRAASNGRNVFWEGGPGGAASFPGEVVELGPEEARRRAYARAEEWNKLPEDWQRVPYWARCIWPFPRGEERGYYTSEALGALLGSLCWNHPDKGWEAPKKESLEWLSSRGPVVVASVSSPGFANSGVTARNIRAWFDYYGLPCPEIIEPSPKPF